MLLTEEEAKTKWCPMFQIGPSTSVGSNRHGLCIASGCTAWREGSPKQEEIERRKAMPTEGRPDGFHACVGEHPNWYWVKYKFTDRGFCGLAGKVE